MQNVMLKSMEINTVKKGFEWLFGQPVSSVKELSRVVSACALWGLPNPYITRLILNKENGAWNSSVRDTARACSALFDAGIIFTASGKWLSSQKSGDSWNEDVYDTAYALKALAEMGIADEAGCRWLYDNYGPAWEQVGTTSLIITALQKQEPLCESCNFRYFIVERAKWVLTQREADGGWKHISTSNLAIQALLFSGFKEEAQASVRWLLEKAHDNGAWGNDKDDVNATALSQITLGIYNSSSILQA